MTNNDSDAPRTWTFSEVTARDRHPLNSGPSLSIEIQSDDGFVLWFDLAPDAYNGEPCSGEVGVSHRDDQGSAEEDDDRLLFTEFIGVPDMIRAFSEALQLVAIRPNIPTTSD